LTYSNQFDTTWIKTLSSVIGNQSGYNGSNDAWKMISGASGTYSIVSQNYSGSGVHTLSLYAKAAEWNYIALFINGSGGASKGAIFDLTTGELTNTIFGSPISYSSNSIGDGWWRLSVTLTGTITGANIYLCEVGTSHTSNNNDGSSGIYIQDAQLEQGLVATDYIETGASTAQAGILEDMPRLDYSGGASCPSLLLEPQRSNLITHSEYFGGYFNVTEINLSYNYAISPDGTLNANKVTFPSTSNSMYKSGLSYSGTHSISFWYKGEGSNVGKTFDVRLQGTSANQNIDVTLESGWKRFEAQSDGLQILEITNRSATTIGAGSLLLYGFQIEAGSYPTSYIPTYGSSVTRSEDVCGATGLSSVIGQTQGVIFMDFIWSNSSPTGGDYALMVYGANTADFVSLNANGNTNQMLVYAGGSAVAAIGGGSFVVGQRYKIALVYSENYFAYYINGVLKGTDTSGAVPNNLQSVRTETPFGLKTSSQKTQQLVFFPTALTDSECIALTTI